MKKYLVITGIFLFMASKFSFANSSMINISKSHTTLLDTLPTESLITYLEQMDVEAYYNKPIDSFLVSLPANFYEMKIYPTKSSKGGHCKASYLSLYFTPSIYGPGVNIYVTSFIHMNRNSSTCTWDMVLFRKEKINRIEIYRDQNTCINGSCLQ